MDGEHIVPNKGKIDESARVKITDSERETTPT